MRDRIFICRDSRFNQPPAKGAKLEQQLPWLSYEGLEHILQLYCCL